MKKEIFKISGMHCASCAMTIERAVSKLPGVKVAQVNFAAETLLTEFDESQVSPKDLKEAVNSVGYKLLTPEVEGTKFETKEKIITEGGEEKKEMFEKSNREFLALRVIGMDSPHCAMVMEKAIKTLPGIEKVEVDYNNARAKVVFDPQKVNEGQIEKVIDDSGYEAVRETSEAHDLLEQEKKRKEKRNYLS